MKYKAPIKSTELVDILQPRLEWNNAKVKFCVQFIIALFKSQTACFSRLAQEGKKREIRIESNLQRIKQSITENSGEANLIAWWVSCLLPAKPPYRFCLDRNLRCMVPVTWGIMIHSNPGSRFYWKFLRWGKMWWRYMTFTGRNIYFIGIYA